MSLRARIMNLTAKPSGLEDSAAHIYRIGYRDARHAAAELAAEADAIRDELVSLLARVRDEADTYILGEALVAEVDAALDRAKGQA